MKYERKFTQFIKMCAEAKAAGIEKVIVAEPGVIGDTYVEVIESLSRLAEAGLSLHVVQRDSRRGMRAP